MPDLSEQLKSLGVKVGAKDLPPPQAANPFTIENVLGGQVRATHFGDTFLVEAAYPLDHHVGEEPIASHTPLSGLAAWCNDQRINDLPQEAFAYLDTETTGLSGGTGTYAFLIGAARFESDHFHLMQIFMRDPQEEPAQLALLEEFLAPAQALVTFNGKSFDIPLLNTRYLAHGWRPPFKDQSHVDLLHLSRRLWRDRLPSRTLGNLEVQILKARRTEDDIPGWMIPQIYFDYLRSADARQMKNVFYHNAMDVVSMAALFQHTAGLLADPLHRPLEYGVDLVSLGRLFEDLDDVQTATHLYLKALEQQLPEPALVQALSHLAMIHKRQDNYDLAIQLWEQATRFQQMEAYIELAKIYEHRLRNSEKAIFWTEAAFSALPGMRISQFEREQWQAELEHRLERLVKKNK
jgi:uncharacterized protein YprB with RNaseH-like and TPR domain